MKVQEYMKNKSVWKIGLSIGIVVVTIIALFILKISKLSKDLLGSNKEEVAAFVKTVDQYIAEGRIPREQIDIIKELSEIVQYKEASTWTALYSRVIVQSAMEDGRISEQEYQNIVSIRDLLRKKNGNLGFVESGKYMNENPHIKEIFESLAKKKQR
jgi:hypothetical protein